MLTSRAEFRLLLSQDSAHYRLTPIAYRLGMVNRERLLRFRKDKKILFKTVKELKSKLITPNRENVEILKKIGTPIIKKPVTAFTLLKRSDVNFEDLALFGLEFKEELSSENIEMVERMAKYEGYIKRENGKIKELKKLSKYVIPSVMNFRKIKSLSKEARDTLERFKPENMAQASRLQGITPSDLTNLLFVLKNQEEGNQ